MVILIFKLPLIVLELSQDLSELIQLSSKLVFFLLHGLKLLFSWTLRFDLLVWRKLLVGSIVFWLFKLGLKLVDML